MAFYDQGLGIAFRRYLFNRSVAEMSLGPVRLFLIEQASGTCAVPGSQALRSYEDHWTPVHLDIVVANLHERTERALSAGARSCGGIDRYGWGRLQKMRDPFGHGFCLIEFQASDYPSPRQD